MNMFLILCRADTNRNGSLDEQEFYQFVEQVKLNYPQLMTYLSMACDYSIEKWATMYVHNTYYMNTIYTVCVLILLSYSVTYC